MNTEKPDQNTTPRPMNEADNLLAHLHARDVLSVIFRREQWKTIIVKLGLTIPVRKEKFFLCGRDGQKTIYFFSGSRHPNRNNGQLEIIGYRFDIAQYRNWPLKGIPNVSDALRYCAFGLTQLEGFDWKKFIFEPERPFLN